MWEVLDKASTMEDPRDILLIDLDQQGKWAIRTRQELERYLRRVEKTKKRETKCARYFHFSMIKLFFSLSIVILTYPFLSVRGKVESETTSAGM